jgi:MFS family permease
MSLRPTSVRFGVLAFACSLSLITYLDRVCISRVQKEIRQDLDIGAKGMGIVFGAFALGYALFEVPVGWLGDRWGSRRVLTFIVIWWSLFTALTGCVWRFTLESGRHIPFGSIEIPLLLNGLVVIVLARFMFGAGEAGAYPNLSRVVKAWFPYRERGLAQGGIWMSARLGGAIAPVVIGRLSAWFGWRQAFWALGTLGIVWAVAFYVWFRDRPEEMPDCNAAEVELIHADLQDRADTPGHSWPGLRPLLTSMSMWALCVASFAVSFGWYFYPTWQPQYLEEVYRISYDDSEILTGLPFLCGAVGSLIGGGISDRLVRRTGRRWGRSLVGLFGFTGAGLCVLATGFVAQAWQAVALLCLAFLINDLAIPVIWAVSADVGGRFVGTVAGVMNTIGAFGALLSPALIPHVLAALPESMPADQRWQMIFAGLAVAWFIAAAAWLFIDASKPLFGRD